MRKILVISAVNLTEGGPLTVLRECVESAARALPNWRIVVMVHDAALIRTPTVEIRTFPRAKSSWLRRVWLEWFGFKPISEELKADLWLSLHDITPRVHARRQAVYCHNPAIFYKLSLREAFLEPKLLLFNLFYGALYGMFISRNRHVIVQQAWLRDEFRRRFGDRSIVVAYPSQMAPQTHGHLRSGRTTIFFYPALARVFKNMEVLGKAAEILASRGFQDFEVRLTITGEENRYARLLRSQFTNNPYVKLIGRQDPRQMHQLYAEASAVVFPSRLETWGLPITEAKGHRLPLLVADAPYARETVGMYDTVSFFPPDRADILANNMQALIEGKWTPSGNVGSVPSEPFAQDWSQLLHLLTRDLDHSVVRSSVVALSHDRVPPKFSLSIVSHGQASMIGLLLTDLAELSQQDFEVIVTVNIPEDESPYQGYPFTVRIIRNIKLQGFGGNHNGAFAESRGEFFVVVNPDIRIRELDFQELILPFENQKIAALAPVILSGEGKIEDSARRFPTLLRFVKRILLQQRDSDYKLEKSFVVVDWVAGMFVVFRPEAYRQIGGFDDRRFFMYLEDADICRRLHEKGWQVIVNPDVQVTHMAQRASRRDLKHMWWHSISALRYLTGI